MLHLGSEGGSLKILRQGGKYALKRNEVAEGRRERGSIPVQPQSSLRGHWSARNSLKHPQSAMELTNTGNSDPEGIATGSPKGAAIHDFRG